MLAHIVLFWLQEDLPVQDQAKFVEGLQSLKNIASTSAVYVGTPANTPPRPVVDASYDYCLTVLLEDMKAHDDYQNDPLHLAFLNDCKPFWKKVVIYDAD